MWQQGWDHDHGEHPIAWRALEEAILGLQALPQADKRTAPYHFRRDQVTPDCLVSPYLVDVLYR